MSQVKLEANIRKETGKGVARKLRREGRVPAVLYGHHLEEPIVLDVDAKATEHILATAGRTGIINLALSDGTSQLAMLAAYQRNVFGTCLMSIDFKQVRMDEKVKATVPVILVGESVGVKNGGVLEHHLREIEVECLPMDIPTHIEVDISALELGHHLTVADIAVPEKVAVLVDEHEQIASVAIPRSVSAAETEETAAEGEEAAE